MQKYFDTVLGSDGSPLVGAQVTVYLTGTTTKATIYTDNGVTEATNPRATDSRGMFAFYAADGRYDIKAEKSGFGTLTMSDIQLDEQDTASTITFAPTGGIAANTVAGALIELDGEIATKEASGTAAVAIAAHLAASNPHPEYLTPAEGDAAYAALGHNHTGTYSPVGHGHTATEISFAPTGNIAASDVASALAELDTEKASVFSGSFTATATGLTTSPTGDIAYVKAGNVVSFQIPTISGTSNSTSFTLTGMPAPIRPSVNRACVCRIQDSGTNGVADYNVTYFI